MLLMLRTFFRQPSDFVLFLASCCAFRFVGLARIVSVLCLVVLFAGDSAMPPTARMTSDEKRIARDMHERGFIPKHIADHLGRDRSTITRLLAQVGPPPRQGRPEALSDVQVARAIRVMEKMIADADGEFEVTVTMVRRRARLRCHDRTLSERLHKMGVYFRKLREKPVLTADDVAHRYAFARSFKSKSAKWWQKSVDIHMDNHCFKVATHARGRRLLAMRRVRGVYKGKGKSLERGYVKPSKALRQNTGARGVLVAGGIGHGSVLVWHVVEGTWGGKEAETLYNDVVAPALKKKFPTRTRFSILEDNDPTGNQSQRGLKAKRDHGINLFQIPKRSPELNVLDYFVWSEVERRMRATERRWPASRRETRAHFIRRLRRTAAALSRDLITKAIGDMKRRCHLLYAAKGGLFEEGGRAPKNARMA